VLPGGDGAVAAQALRPDRYAEDESNDAIESGANAASGEIGRPPPIDVQELEQAKRWRLDSLALALA
jgi:hypothetical protein